MCVELVWLLPRVIVYTVLDVQGKGKEKNMSRLLSVTLTLLIVCSASFADDIHPPPWQRGSDGTTMAQWEFLTSDPNPIPDILSNRYGPTIMSVYPGVGQAWWEIWGDRDGVWPLSGTIEIEIANRPEPLPYKDIWVQVTWAEQAPGTAPYVWETISGLDAQLIDEIPLGPTAELPPAGDTWWHSTYLIHIEPNPDFEIVRIDGAVMIDEIVIDTICIPEPATLGLLLIGGLALLRRR